MEVSLVVILYIYIYITDHLKLEVKLTEELCVLHNNNNNNNNNNSQGTPENSHIGHCTHTSESAKVKVQ